MEKDIYKNNTIALNNSVKGSNNMLSKLFKIAHNLDKRGFYDESQAISEAVADLASRVGIDTRLKEMAIIADYLDQEGEVALASTFDDVLNKVAYRKDDSSKV